MVQRHISLCEYWHLSTLTDGTESAEGSWDEVMRLIGQAHTMLHKKGIMRIQTDIRVGSRYILHCYRATLLSKAADDDDDIRIDKQQTFRDKVTAVNQLLNTDEEK